MVRTRRRRVDLGELAKDQIVMLRRDADTGIANLDQQLGEISSPAHLCLEPDATAGGGEVDRVAEEVADDVRHLLSIGDDRRHRRLDLDLKIEALAGEE